MEWIFALFPSGTGLGQSVITTVWIGIAVVCFLNLRFGFPLTGLVVPGYLVPLLIVSPTSAVVILIEAIIVYALMFYLAKYWLQKLGYAEMFGRDRFFAIILLSILVRVFMDILFWPKVAMWFSAWDITFDYSAQLYSLGLIIIALTANVMWNGGFKYGVKVTAIQLIITFVIVRYILMPFTNFSIANLAIMYEAVAASIIAAPKAYIILVITAFIASRANIKYGWEFNGIMLPALLALQLMQPAKLLTSFVETGVILIVGSLLLTKTRLKHAHLEGARLLLFFFNIGFIYKLILNYVVVHHYPAIKVTDTFAFGYMLSTLLALKIYQKNALGLVIRATFQTSVIGGFVAIVIGFVIMFVPSLFKHTSSHIAPSPDSQQTLSQHISEYKSYLYSGQKGLIELSQFEENQQRQNFRQAVLLLTHQDMSLRDPNKARWVLDEIDFQLYEDTVYYFIRDKRTASQRGFFVISKAPNKQHIITVPHPLTETVASDAASLILDYLGSRALAFGTQPTPDFSSQATETQSSYFGDFLVALDGQEVLQLRSINNKTASVLSASKAGNESQMWIYNQIPDSLSQQSLNQLLNIEHILFGLIKQAHLPITDFSGQLAEVFLDTQSYTSLLSKVLLKDQSNGLHQVEELSDTLDQIVKRFSKNITAKGSQQFELLTSNEAALWEFEILTPLYQLIEKTQGRVLSPTDRNRLQQINQTAKMVGYELKLLVDQGKRFLVFLPIDSPEYYRRGQGLYAVNLGSSDAINIQVPRPLFESNTLQFASQLYIQSNAQLLLVAGSHPYASADANVMAPNNIRTLFNVFHQSALRYYPDSPRLNIQLRSHSAPSHIRPSALAYQFTHPQPHHQSTITQLYAAFEKLGITVQKVEGSKATRGLELGTSPQSGYQIFSPQSELATLWLASDFKQHFSISDTAIKERLLAVTNQDNLHSLDILTLSPNDWQPISSDTLANLQQATNAYAQQQNITLLANLCHFLTQCQLKPLLIKHNGALSLGIYQQNKIVAFYFPTRNVLIHYDAFSTQIARGNHVLD